MKSISIIFLFLIALGFSSCSDVEIHPRDYAIAFTGDATDIDQNGVTLHAKMINLGQKKITEYGFMVINNKIDNEDDFRRIYSTKGELKTSTYETRVLNDLDSGFVYLYRTFICSNQDTILGNKIRFTSKGSGEVVANDLSPVQGYMNSIVRIHGQNLNGNSKYIKVYMKDEQATILTITSNYIDFIVPRIYTAGVFEVNLKKGLKSIVLKQKFKYMLL